MSKAQDNLFNIGGKRIAITGGAGVLGGSLAKALAARGAKLAVLDCNYDAAEALCEDIQAASQMAKPVNVDVLDKSSIEAACDETIKALGGVDVLINAAGGNKTEATTAPGELAFFDLPAEALKWVMDLNCLGTILSCQIFAKGMTSAGAGVIINFSSMCAFTPLTRVAAYSAAKAAVSNFTQWLAVDLCRNHSQNIRVNAVAPGFFLTEQNRFLLKEKNGELTERGRQIIDHTPMARFGDAEDLIGTVIWLMSDAAEFVTGVVVPVDGGFSAFSGV